MRFLGLSPAVFAGGLVVLAGALLALHLLRVRVRRVTVETLLFFKALGEVSRPRVLLGRPARWKAFVLGFLLLASLWAAFADLALESGGRSRVVLVDASGSAAAPVASGEGEPGGRTLLGARLDAARSVVTGKGLGPHGAVLAFGGEVTTLLAAGEPVALLDFRGARLVPTGPGSALDEALGQARAFLGGNAPVPGAAEADASEERGEILLIGGPASPPRAAGGVPVVTLPLAPPLAHAGISDVALEDWPERKLVVEVTGSPGKAVLEAGLGGAEPVRRELEIPPGAAARTEVLLGTADATRVSLAVRVAGGPAPVRVELEVPARERIPVTLAAGLPDVVRLAVEADPALEVAAGSPGRVEVRRGGSAPTGIPTLVLEAGTDPARRTAEVTAHCPLPLGLRDQTRPSAGRLDLLGGGSEETVWIADRERGDPLVAAHAGSGGVPRVRVVEWLLDDVSHRDVPRLIAGALRCLAGVTDPVLVPAGARVELAAVVRAPLVAGAATHLPLHGRYRVSLTPGRHRLEGASGPAHDVQAFATIAPPLATSSGASATEAVAVVEALSGPGRLLPLLLLLALGLLLLDAALFHAGRIP